MAFVINTNDTLDVHVFMLLVFVHFFFIMKVSRLGPMEKTAPLYRVSEGTG